MPKETFFNLPNEKRNRIIDSATLEFSKKHYRKVSIDSIITNAEIPKGSFYQYFENKDDLYSYLFSQIGNQKKHELEEIQEYAEKLDFREYIHRLLEEANKFENKDAKLIELKKKFMNECPQEVKNVVLKNEIPKSYRLMEAVILFYIEKGELRKNLNTKTAAYMITSCIVSLENYEFEEGERISNAITNILDVLIDGIKKQDWKE